jgi:polyhydroxybutyrate depolymerase
MSRSMIRTGRLMACAALAAACSSDGSDTGGSNAPESPPATTNGMPDPASTNGVPSSPPSDDASSVAATGGASVEEGQNPGDLAAPGAGEVPSADEGGMSVEPENPPAMEDPSDSPRSAGCGAATEVASGRFSIDAGDLSREYILALPDDYDSSRAYPLIFTWHPGGGTAQGTAGGFGGGYYGLRDLADGSAIFVSPEGIDNGWANTGGRDLAFARAMLDRFEAELCIDNSRIFSTGFSYGGMMSNALGCAMGDVFRAIAPMSGALFSGCEDGDDAVAVWAAHGDTDQVVSLANGERARDEFLERNNCQPESVPVEPGACISYQGCDADNPVIWCEFSGGHTPAPGSAQAIWNFFSQF